ncbi:hypothetical protein D3C77_673370 [compost metagenome]
MVLLGLGCSNPLSVGLARCLHVCRQCCFGRVERHLVQVEAAIQKLHRRLLRRIEIGLYQHLVFRLGQQVMHGQVDSDHGHGLLLQRLK